MSLLVKAERTGRMGKSFEFKECERFLKRVLKDKGMYSKGGSYCVLDHWWYWIFCATSTSDYLCGNKS